MIDDATSPKPMPFEDVARVLDAIGRTDLVLVGGQAVALWAYHYARAGRLPELSTEREMFVSKDVDAFARFDDVPGRTAALARELDGDAHLDAAAGVRSQELPIPARNAALVAFVDGAGDLRAIDILDELFGLDAADVLDTAAELVAPNGTTVFALHPVLLVESRIANCADLEKYRTPLGIRQAEVSFGVLREFLVDVAPQHPRRTRRQAARVARLCTSERGLRAYEELGLDAWPAVRACVPLLGQRFAELDYPKRTQRIVSARAAWASRT